MEFMVVRTKRVPVPTPTTTDSKQTSTSTLASFAAEIDEWLSTHATHSPQTIRFWGMSPTPSVGADGGSHGSGTIRSKSPTTQKGKSASEEPPQIFRRSLSIHLSPFLHHEFWTRHGLSLSDIMRIIHTTDEPQLWHLALWFEIQVPNTALKPSLEKTIIGDKTIVHNKLRQKIMERFPSTYSPPRTSKLCIHDDLLDPPIPIHHIRAGEFREIQKTLCMWRKTTEFTHTHKVMSVTTVPRTERKQTTVQIPRPENAVGVGGKKKKKVKRRGMFAKKKRPRRSGHSVSSSAFVDHIIPRRILMYHVQKLEKSKEPIPTQKDTTTSQNTLTKPNTTISMEYDTSGRVEELRIIPQRADPEHRTLFDTEDVLIVDGVAHKITGEMFYVTPITVSSSVLPPPATVASGDSARTKRQKT